MAAFYLIHVEGDTDPEMWGPYETAEKRDEAALFHRQNEDPEGQDGLFPLDGDIVDGALKLDIGSYSSSFFENLS